MLCVCQPAPAQAGAFSLAANFRRSIRILAPARQDSPRWNQRSPYFLDALSGRRPLICTISGGWVNLQSGCKPAGGTGAVPEHAGKPAIHHILS